MKKVLFLYLCIITVAYSQTIVTEITSNTTWTAANSPYILEGGNTTDEIALLIHNDSQPVTLTIEAGVTIIGKVYRVSFGGGFWNDEPQVIKIGNNGAIKALGTASNPVVFKGDTTVSITSSEFWGGILIDETANTSEIEFHHTYFEKGGFEMSAVVEIETGKPLFSNCTFWSNKKGIWANEKASPLIYYSRFLENHNEAIELNNGNAEIVGNTFLDNDYAIEMWKDFPALLENNLFGDDQEINLPELITNNAVVKIPGFYLNGGVAYYTLRSPGQVNQISVNVKAAQLKIDKGVIIKGTTSIPLWPNEEPAYIQLDVGGSLVVEGTESEPVIFTTSDDEISRGDWGGIYFTENANGAGSVINHAIIEAAGFEFDGAVTILSNAPTFKNTEIRTNHIGIYVDENADVIVENCYIHDHYYNGIELIDEGSTIIGTRFSNNGKAINLNQNFPDVIRDNILDDDEIIKLPDYVDLDYSLPIPGKLRSGATAPYYLLCPGVTNRPAMKIENSSLNILPGVEIRGDYRNIDWNEEPAYLEVGINASIKSTGTSDLPVLFTCDNEEKKWSRWGGIILRGFSNTDETIFKHTHFEASGFEFSGAIEIYGGSPVIDNCFFTLNDDAVYVDSGSTPTISNSLFYLNNSSAIVIGGNSSPVIESVISDSNRYAIDLNDASFTMRNSEITKSSTDGMYINNGTDILIENTNIHNNKNDGIYIPNESVTTMNIQNSSLKNNGRGINAYMENGSDIVINYSEISGNRDYGIDNHDEIVINAKNNWWGDPTGPYDNSDDSNDPTGLFNPGGLGDEVEDYVDYGDWITFLETESPNILCIEDVPNDQGRWIHLCWSASSLDKPNSNKAIVKYSVWRMVDENVCPEKPQNQIGWMKKSAVDKLNSEGWDFIHDVTAVPEFSKYFYVAPTLGDSNHVETYFSTFMVIAHTSNPSVYFMSSRATGFSVDNIAPPVPEGLIASQINDQTVELNWKPVFEGDFDHYILYKNGELLAECVDTLFVDNDLNSSTINYSISAVDFNGNESDKSNDVNVVVGVNDEDLLPKKFDLSQNFPNPFNPSTQINYQVPEEAFVSIIIYDILGNQISNLVSENKKPGFYSVMFDAGNTATGVYVYRMTANEFTSTQKMILLK